MFMTQTKAHPFRILKTLSEIVFKARFAYNCNPERCLLKYMFYKCCQISGCSGARIHDLHCIRHEFLYLIRRVTSRGPKTNPYTHQKWIPKSKNPTRGVRGGGRSPKKTIFGGPLLSVSLTFPSLPHFRLIAPLYPPTELYKSDPRDKEDKGRDEER